MAQVRDEGADATKIDSLTGLRLFAALAVFGSHLAYPAAAPETVSTFLGAGYNGVTLFFILSGFVLTWTYADRMTATDERTLWNFAVARFARIAPLYFLALGFAILVLGGALPRSTWLHVLALQTWHPEMAVAYALNKPAWSIGIEVFLYAAFPMVLLALVPRDRRRLLLIAAGSVAVLALVTAVVYAAGRSHVETGEPWSDHHLLYRTPLTRLPDFVLGCTTALLVRRSSGPSRGATVTQWAAVLVIGALMCSDRMSFSILSWDLAYAVPFAALIWALAMAPHAPLARLLASPLVVRGGVISFAFYLFHVSLLQVIEVDTTSWGSWFSSVRVALAVTLLVAAAAHYAVEVPAQRWLRTRLSMGMETPAPAAATEADRAAQDEAALAAR